MAEDPIGVKIPIGMGNTGFFDQTFTVLDETKSMMLNLLLTRKGERFMQPEFGTSIYDLLFEPVVSTIESSLKAEIRVAVSTWLPHVELLGIEIDIDKENIENNKIGIKVIYALKQDTSKFDEVQVAFVL